jgi:hypothetical protein
MKQHTFRDDWPAPNDDLLELGKMTSIWGTLESTVNIAISKFAGYQSTASIPAAQTSGGGTATITLVRLETGECQVSEPR